MVIGKGILESIAVTNSQEDSYWVMLFDSETVPEDEAVPVMRFPLPAESTVSFDVAIPVVRGLIAIVSTTPDVLTTGEAEVFYYGIVSDDKPDNG